jgi:hypothetical protein
MFNTVNARNFDKIKNPIFWMGVANDCTMTYQRLAGRLRAPDVFAELLDDGVGRGGPGSVGLAEVAF